jgi:hypothetical protein
MPRSTQFTLPTRSSSPARMTGVIAAALAAWLFLVWSIWQVLELDLWREAKAILLVKHGVWQTPRPRITYAPLGLGD